MCPAQFGEAWAASATKEADKMEGFKSLAPEKPRFVTAAELDRMELPPIQWAVPGLLPAGLVFLQLRQRWARAGWPLISARLWPLVMIG